MTCGMLRRSSRSAKLTLAHTIKYIYGPIMKEATKRAIVRWIHIVIAIPIIGYIYSPFEEIPNYAPAVRFVFLPVMVLSGFWMWKGHVIRRLFSKRWG